MKNPFKNFKTKKRLREEIAFLKGQQCMQPPVLRVERDIIKLGTQVNFDRINDIPADYLKREAVRKLTDQLEPFIEWNLVETEYGNSLMGTVCIISRG